MAHNKIGSEQVPCGIQSLAAFPKFHSMEIERLPGHLNLGNTGLNELIKLLH